MNSLAEIEAAAVSLPRPQQEELLQRLTKHLGAGPSCYDLVRELFEEPGHLGNRGTPDLSTNKKHMADFGRPSRRIRE